MWHKILLQQMTQEIPEIRPAVISQETCKHLDELRGFRHVVRNVYTFKFTAEKIETLVEHAPALFSQVRSELLSFADFLEQQA
jgi:hypothetical protein